MSDKVCFSKALYTSNISQDEATEWFEYLQAHTENFIKENHGWYVSKGYWPIKARVEGGADPDPKFFVIHHTSNMKGLYKPALNRFFQAKMASSNLLIAKDGTPLYLVDLRDQSYHATVRTWLPIDVRRALGLEGKWINEPGFEIAGNGMNKLFTHEQIVSSICCGRYTKSFYPTITEVKSHRFFSRRARAGDPGYLFFLPLVEHAIFNDIDLSSKEYWVKQYQDDPVKFANNAGYWIKNLGLEDRDEWSKYRKRKITSKHLL